ADDYLSRHGASVLPSHRRAIADILACRTHALGGHLWRCNHCSTEVYSYHSCKNRSCPRCHKDQTERWIAAREAELLACPYFHVTVTVPAELREVLRANQRDGYAALMKATAEAISELARDRRHVGGTVGVMAVLHTWTQQLFYHPHVHCLVTGGGVSDDGLDWHPACDNFLVPTRPLAVLVRAKMRAARPNAGPISACPRRYGGSVGSSTARPGVKAPRPCCAIWHATSFAWRATEPGRCWRKCELLQRTARFLGRGEPVRLPAQLCPLVSRQRRSFVEPQWRQTP